MALNQGNVAQNVRRLAGLYLVSLEQLAGFVRISRQSMQTMVAHEPHHRSLPKADTAIRIAEAFGVSLNALYSDPVDCLREAVEHFEEAPIAAIVEPPGTNLGPRPSPLPRLRPLRDAKQPRGHSPRKGRK
jgi:DNA-binding XRE family transcriptional regulator